MSSQKIPKVCGYSTKDPKSLRSFHKTSQKFEKGKINHYIKVQFVKPIPLTLRSLLSISISS